MASPAQLPLTAYPTLTRAAEMLGVSASTLSRREDVAAERMGERDLRVPAGEVMRLADVFRKRDLNEVAAKLLAHTRDQAPAHVEEVQEEIEQFVERRTAPARMSAEELLELVKHALSPEAHRELERVYRENRGKRFRGVVSES